MAEQSQPSFSENGDVQSSRSSQSSYYTGGTPQPDFIPTIPAAAPASKLPFRFIDERQRQSSPKVRKEVRAHVRRSSHLKQKRLNDASKPKSASSGQRPLLLRPAPGGSSDTNKNSESQAEDASEPSDVSLDFPLSRWQYNNSTPYALLLDEHAPILQLSGSTWPFPQPIRGNEPAISIWMPQNSIPISNARAPRPCLLKSARTISWIANSVDYLYFKHEVIQWVNSRLGSPDCATNDVTIGVIICLMSWEISRSNIQELKLHVEGLSRIIQLRGGASDIPNTEHFCWKIALIDLLVAILTSNEPIFDFRFQEDLLRPPLVNRSLGSIQKPDSPLYGTEPFTNLLQGSQFSQDDVLLLQLMRDLTRESQNVRSRDFDVLSKSISNSEGSSSIISQMILAASKIYISAFKDPPVLFSSPNNTKAIETICSCLEDTTQDETWTEYPGILLWVLLTGLAAAVGKPHCSFFAIFAFRIGTSAAWWGPREAREAFMVFLDVKRRAEGRRI